MRVLHFIFVGLSLVGLLLFSKQACARVCLNEVQSVNDATCFDEDGASSDWIELYNDAETPADLSGWGLSDKTSKPFKWVFPAGTTLAAKGRLVVFASGKDRAPASPVVPESVEGLRLWLKGDDALAAVGDGGKVSKWLDTSGWGNNATNTNYRPTAQANAANGHAAVKFVHSSGHTLFLPTTTFNGMSSLSNASVFVVCKWTGTTTTSVGLFGQWKNSSSTPNCHFEVQSGGVVRWRVADLDLKSSSGCLAANTWTILEGMTEMNRETPRAALYRNGVKLLEQEGSVGKTSFAQADRLYIGNACMLPTDGTSSHRAFDGQIAEVAIFNRALTADERAGVNAYLSEKYRLGEKPLHTNFSLSGEGETLVLSAPDGTVADTATFGKIPCGSSWGRARDGAETWGYFAAPTPAAANGGTLYGAPLAPVVFDPPRGVYSAPLTVSLSHPDPEAVIYYTRDHSEPSAANGYRYMGAPLLVTKSTFLRATAVKAEALPTRNVMTHSYLFLADAAVNPGVPSGLPSTWSANGSSKAVYGVSSAVVKSSADIAALVRALQGAPILSVVLPDEALFGSAPGIYTHPTTDGLEAAASLEWLAPGGTDHFQLDAGLRAQGAASRNFGGQPKKSFRLAFRGRYGAGTLERPVFAAGGCETGEFNTLVLRAEYNNSWTHSDAAQRPRGSFVRDQFMRDVFRAMGQPGAAGVEAHLFLNGYYWGLYNVTERPDAAFAVTYYGGQKEEWDVLKSNAEVRDGDAAAWKALYTATGGTLSNAAGYAAVTNLLDVANFADYMLLNHWAGNQDWPHNNWVAIRRRVSGERFRFCAWDAERTLEGVDDNRLSAVDTSSQNPGVIHNRLLASAAYKALYAVRARRHLHPRHGALASTNAIARWERMCAAVEPNVFAEAARWGTYRKDAGNTSSTYNLATWQAERVRVRDVYLPARNEKFVAKLKSAGLWTDPDPAEEAVFLPADKANWDDDDNWSTAVYPDLPGAKARVCAPPASGVDAGKGWRNVRLKSHDVVVGALTVENGAFQNRFCNKDDVVEGAAYGLIFDSGVAGTAAVLDVCDRTGCGMAIFENDYPTSLASDLRVIVENPEGTAAYGALRLQKTWEGPGAFIKEGPGRCSLTGEGKNWRGGTRVRAGLLSATAKSFPQGRVTLEPGGAFLVVGASSAEAPFYQPRFRVEGPAPELPLSLYLRVKATTEGLLFSVGAARERTIVLLR